MRQGVTGGQPAASSPQEAPHRWPANPAPIKRATDLTGVLILKHEDLFLLTDPFGDIHADSRGLGLYQDDTRLLSHYEVRIDEQRPVILRTGVGGSFTSRLQLTNPAYLRNPDGPDPEIGLRAQSLGILRERVLAGGFRERITVDNFTTEPELQRISLRLAADYADIFEVRGLERERRGEYLPVLADADRVVFAYRGLDGRLWRTHVSLSQPAARIEEGPLLLLDWELPAGGQRTLEVTVWGEVLEGADAEGALERDWPPDPPPVVLDDAPAAAHRAWKASSAAIETPDAFVTRALRRSLADLRLLINQGPATDERYIAAGVPWFTCLFGRDSIISALQLLAVRPQVACDTLQLLARLQATEVDEWRDAQPGKILHELRNGELARAGEIPHSPYYGSVDSTPLWLVLLGETHSWTGDDALVDALWPHALAALRWIDESGDSDGDGFVEYERYSPRGLLNQGWKDSRDANRFRDGRLAEAPIALVEVQAYVYAARLHVARLARRRGDEELATRQEEAARSLRQRFEEAFWMDDVGTYALALDGQKRQVDAIGSNAGHALWCGIVSPERAGRVAANLLSPGMWSGWGVRTLSREMAGYNPIGYHIGSIWPHDNAIVAEGLIRYGHREEANAIAAAMLEATSYFRDSRLPELFCGFGREESPYPVPYPVACTPQAWAAGSVFQLLTTMLGLRPDASRHQLELHAPTLPEWLGELKVENMRVGDAALDLLFRRSNGSTGVEVLRRTGDLSVVLRI
jgi:glycogen debranching enzyme